MAWIESHQNLGRHPKLLRLAAKLRINKAQAIGHLQYLWWWTLDFSVSGDLSAFTSAEISAASEWPGDSEVFLSALKETGWLSEDGKINNWSDYAGQYLAGLERQRRYREKTYALRNSNVTVTANHTIPNQTKPKKSITLDQDDNFKEFWDYYPKRPGSSKIKAQESWRKLKPSSELVETIMAALKSQKSSQQWLKNNGEFIPHATTWINQRRWEVGAGPPQLTQAEIDSKRRERWATRGLCTVCGGTLSLAVDGEMRCNSCMSRPVISIVKIKGVK